MFFCSTIRTSITTLLGSAYVRNLYGLCNLIASCHLLILIVFCHLGCKISYIINSDSIKCRSRSRR